MRKRPILTGALLGGLTSLPVIAIYYLGEQFAGLPFLPFDLFDWLARNLPGDLITAGIDALVALISALNVGPTSAAAKAIEQLTGMLLIVGGGVVLGALTAWLARRLARPTWQVGTAAGTLLLAISLALVIDLDGLDPAGLAVIWLALLNVGWGAVLGRLLAAVVPAPAGEPEAAPAPRAEVDEARRAALVKIIGGSVAVTLGAWAAGRLFAGQEAGSGAGRPLADVPTPQPGLGATPTPGPGNGNGNGNGGAVPGPTATATTRDRLPPAPGTRPELTDNDDFYRIDINTRPVVIDGQSWVLQVDGLFGNPHPLTLQNLMAYPAVTQPITLSCISNRVAGDLIGTSNWTGARLRDVLQDLGLRREAQELYVEAADGFFESVTMQDMMDPRTLLVYAMNGETLPVEHGDPLRIYIADRYGMKQPKWITRIEAIGQEGPGYWVERGWSEEARPQIVSVIDAVAFERSPDGTLPVGGIAWAGDRGIQKVELQVDGGEWLPVTLRNPPLSPLTWVQWRYDWPAEPGRHTLTVRATDDTSALQVVEEAPPHPNGATGYHSVDVSV